MLKLPIYKIKINGNIIPQADNKFSKSEVTFKEKRIIKGALNKMEPHKGKNDLAIPIPFKDQVIGVLYLQGEDKAWLL